MADLVGASSRRCVRDIWLLGLCARRRMVQNVLIALMGAVGGGIFCNMRIYYQYVSSSVFGKTRQEGNLPSLEIVPCRVAEAVQ